MMMMMLVKLNGKDMVLLYCVCVCVCDVKGEKINGGYYRTGKIEEVTGE
jgi:hypothetical protein